MKNKINDKLFTGDSSNKDDLKLIHQSMQNNFKEELVSLICIAEEYFVGLDLKEIKDDILRINTNESLNPFIFSAYQNLVESLESKDVKQIQDSLIILAEGKNKLSNSYNFLIRSFDLTIFADHSMSRFILGSGGPRTIDGEIAVMEQCTKEELDNLKVFIEKAISIIKENDEGLFSEFNEYVRALVLFDGSVVTGATSIRSFGNIYLRFPKKELSEIEKIMYFVEHIAHETSHLHLHALMVHDVMILNTLAEKYEAPIRPDPRPMFGIFHATFVLTRMIRVFESWISRESSAEVSRRLDTFKGMHDKGRSVISEHGKLTTIGTLVFESLKY